MKNILFIFLILLSVACSRQWPGQLTDTDMAPYADIAVTESARGSDRNALVDGDPFTYWTSPAELTNPIILFSFKEPVAMDKVVLREFKEGGNRVGYFVVEGYVKTNLSEVLVSHKAYSDNDKGGDNEGVNRFKLTFTWNGTSWVMAEATW